MGDEQIATCLPKSLESLLGIVMMRMGCLEPPIPRGHFVSSGPKNFSTTQSLYAGMENLIELE